MWTSSKKSKKKTMINNNDNSFRMNMNNLNEKNLFSLKIQKDNKNLNLNNYTNDNNLIYSNVYNNKNDSSIKCKLILSSRIVKSNYKI
jgi:hypothetical protein